ncbi:juvenile hormone acid O-methyltransferase-like [Odontomachus brunneus]|uniref:juvenile hormone acid O-methyltransferase-like n=1 Tax=Odontomachus brunneus TaxID=486640 RepID=UPI0013F1B24F|nr:juvenile hormone acid O-methyltransferase-like [Odontomachus brunneus]XP_032688167.1 juvenile hormone acid O-methyltransferase-like [Odontomachus brunneus]XP_032688168.1 juvenile hormone acid O-methyltransferase-like [Odontomachus brunneus]
MANPMKYIQTNNFSHSTVQHLLHEFEEELGCMSGKCMDIGCGPGDVTRYTLLPALHPNAVVIGTDISEDMIKYAKELHANEERLEFEILDIQTKHLPEKHISAYDHVFTFHVLHWCADMRQVFENIYHLLRPGGTVLILTIISNDVFDILHELKKDNRYTSYMKHANNFIPVFHDSKHPHKDLKALLRSVRFNVHHCSHRERTFSAHDAQKIPEMILSFITQFFEDMPHDRIAELEDEFTQKYMNRRFFHKRGSNQNEKIASDLHEILIVYAQKDNDVENMPTL